MKGKSFYKRLVESLLKLEAFGNGEAPRACEECEQLEHHQCCEEEDDHLQREERLSFGPAKVW